MDFSLIAQSFSWASGESWWAMARVALGLGFVIFIHELGHFLVAKACGVKCEKFYVGFDAFDIKIGDLVLIPKALLKWQWGETEYGIGILPLGGYVKMLGQDDNPGNMEEEIQRSKLETATAAADQETLAVLDRDQMDPRSFLAKNVPQRMAIISAGVIFNLISAVIMAAIAFKSGVVFDPPTVGDVTPGGPAWEGNLYGAKIAKIADSEVKGYYRFNDLAQEVALSGEGQTIPIVYYPLGSDETESVELEPRLGLNQQLDLALLGMQPASLPKVRTGDDILIEGNPAFSAEPPFHDNDTVRKIGDEDVNDIFDLRRLIGKYFDKQLVMTVEREDETLQEITVDTNPQRTAGIIMEFGEVWSIQADSPAANAGIMAGDKIVKIDGQGLGDLFTLEQRMTRIARDGKSANPDASADDSANRSVQLTVERGGETLEIEITPRLPLFFANLYAGQPVAINSLGIAFVSSRIVAESSVEGLQPGDELTEIKFLLEDKKQKEIFDQIAKNNLLTLEKIGWPTAQQLIQTLPSGFDFEVTANRSSESVKAKGTTKTTDGFFVPTRGILLAAMEETYTSSTWQDAFYRGASQTYWDGNRIFRFLGKLVQGQISPKNLGGPGLIAAAATSEASQGTSRLLLFLTLLSANLAIVNFLPIPVLDGGHMLFLAYEGIFRQPPNEKVQILLTWAGLFMILGLMLYVILLDIQRFVF